MAKVALIYIICLFLSNQVAYQGVPEKAYEVFVNALQSTFLSQGIDIPSLDDHNPAGIYVQNVLLYTVILSNLQILLWTCLETRG